MHPKFAIRKQQEILLEDMRPSRIFRHILEEIYGSKEYLYLIMGVPGPTGKTWLCNALKQQGYNAVDLAEEICYDVDYIYDNENRYYINLDKKLIIVVLNKPLTVEKGEKQ